MLQEFIAANHAELVSRCNRKSGTPDLPWSAESGVPLFLDQLVETLKMERVSEDVQAEQVGTQSEIGRAAANRGAELLQRGYTVDEVVHEYGNVCQAVTELAIEASAPISNEEFRTLNRCLDDAIADAVTSYALAAKNRTADREHDLHARLDFFAQDHLRLLDVATQAFAAIKGGNVGPTGATGLLLAHALTELRELAGRALPEIQRATSATAD